MTLSCLNEERSRDLFQVRLHQGPEPTTPKRPFKSGYRAPRRPGSGGNRLLLSVPVCKPEDRREAWPGNATPPPPPLIAAAPSPPVLSDDSADESTGFLLISPKVSITDLLSPLTPSFALYHHDLSSSRRSPIFPLHLPLPSLPSLYSSIDLSPACEPTFPRERPPCRLLGWLPPSSARNAKCPRNGLVFVDLPSHPEANRSRVGAGRRSNGRTTMNEHPPCRRAHLVRPPLGRPTDMVSHQSHLRARSDSVISGSRVPSSQVEEQEGRARQQDGEARAQPPPS